MATQQTKDGLGYIIQAISNIVEPKMETLKYDKTYRAKVTQKIDAGVYTVQINGTSYKLSYSGTLNVGDIVRVKAPLNNFSDIYIEPLPGSGGGGTGGTTNYNDLTNKPVINSTYSTAQSTNASEILKGTIALHKISKTGNYNDLLNKPSLNFIPISQKGVADGVATLGADSIIPKSQLPANTVYDTNYKHIDVEDNLTSSSSDNALSANQGRILESRIEQNDTMITTLQEDVIQAEDNITKIKKDYIPLTQKGYANGVASLDINAKILPIQLPIATATTLGAFKIGKNLTIDADGTLNATGGGVGSNEVEISEDTPTESSVELWVDLNENPSYAENQVYSTTETKIGTWIDGKTIYRKVIVDTTFRTDFYSVSDNIENFVDQYGYVQRKDYPNTYQFISSRAGTEMSVQFLNSITNSGVQIDWGTNWKNNYATLFNKIVIVVEYTKTTD